MKKIYKIAAVIMLTVVVGSVSYFVGGKDDSNNISIHAVVTDPNSTLQEKVAFLELQRSEVMGKWDVLKNNSDLCSNKYVTQIRDIGVQYGVINSGYKTVSENYDLSQTPVVQELFDDINKRNELYNKFIDELDKENYEEAVKILTELDAIDNKTYEKLASEISSLGE